MKYKIFVDGREGTTGLKIVGRLEKREDVELLGLPEEQRKVKSARKEIINSADFVFLCLPDEAAKEAVNFVGKNSRTKIIDASTAHRINPDWVYGFPELSVSQREKISSGKRVAVPGCYAGGFIALVYPLVQNGVIATDSPVYCHAVSGYSGAGKKGIAEYVNPGRSRELDSPRAYALGQNHKHLSEMQTVCGLSYPPAFNPFIAGFYSGMAVFVQIHTRTLPKNISGNNLLSKIKYIYKTFYGETNFINLEDSEEENSYISAVTLAGKDNMQILVTGNEDRITLVSRFDNLGKGSSGAAVQCLNIMMGIDETTGLNI